MKFLILLLITLSTHVFAQRSQTITADCLRIQDGACVDKNELGYLNGVTSNLQTQIDAKAGSSGNESISGTKTFTGKLVTTSTTNGAHPCPSMSDAQMLAIVSPSNGDCAHNTTLESWLIYNSTESIWEEVGSGGLSAWVTAKDYEIGDVVIETGKIYIALTDHTSGTFATDLATNNWELVKAGVDVADISGVLSMASGGTDKNLTPVLGGIVYTDAGSMEVLAAGTPGQVLQSNGAAAPAWADLSALAPTPIGAVIASISSTDPSGYVSAMNKTIGVSGADYSGSTYFPLYEMLWGMGGLSTTAGDPFRISSSKGASALADWNASKLITLDFVTNEVFIRGKGASRNLGSYQNSGSPNITGTADAHGLLGSSEASQVFNGAFSRGTSGAKNGANASGTFTNQRITFDASDSSSVYQAGLTEVRPKNVALNYYIKY